MPHVHKSFYTDEAYGNRFWTFLSAELPSIVHPFFRLSDRREDRFVAGLSMGGYGALKWALRQPDRFGAAASLSGALDIEQRQRSPRQEDPQLMYRVFGDRPVGGTDNDLHWLLDTVDPALARGCTSAVGQKTASTRRTSPSATPARPGRSR